MLAPFVYLTHSSETPLNIPLGCKVDPDQYTAPLQDLSRYIAAVDIPTATSPCPQVWREGLEQ